MNTFRSGTSGGPTRNSKEFRGETLVGEGVLFRVGISCVIYFELIQTIKAKWNELLIFDYVNNDEG